MLPSVLKYVRKTPSCAACLFAKTQRSAFRNKGKMMPFIQKACHIFPGKGSSAKHSISHQPATMVDHASNFSYYHIIRETTVAENVDPNAGDEQIIYEYGYRVEAYHGDRKKM
eukprot:13323990-Ditylum_brightwellii.AAC.1